MTAEVLTDRAVNPAQLSYELGGAGLRVVGPYPDDLDDEALAGKTKVAIVDGGVDQAALEAAIGEHVADPEWADPDPRPHVPMDETGRILTLLALYEGSALPSASEIVKMRDGLTVDECAAEFYAWLEAADGGL